ncbi:MAG: hypothetical protein GX775_01685 [Erysipelothrix sp.]|nr:hypothetical protein [Erysipelothrix sp.]
MLIGCTNSTSVKGQKYCSSVADGKAVEDSLEFKFESDEVQMTNALISFMYMDAEYTVTDDELIITGTGLPDSYTAQYTLVFTIDDDNLVFTEDSSTIFDNFSLKEGNTLVRGCE